MKFDNHNRKTYGTYLLLATLITGFGVEIYYISMFGEEFIRTYMLSMKNLQNGVYISVLTSIFLHAGLVHLISNSAAVYLFGKPVERRLGSLRMLILFLLSGIVGGLIQIAFTPGSSLVGASGGAFGLVAVAMLLDPGDSLMEEIPIVRWFSFPIIRNIFSVAFIAALMIVGETQASFFMTLEDQVAHTAHLAGFITGAVLSYLWRPETTKESSLIALPFLGLLGLLVFPFGNLQMEKYALAGLLVLLILVRIISGRK